ncbi:MAG: cysteine peptidase family C39 domain-containing protein [bacterium]|nr:cysteine peptidase family C39 domain-containing protein [bacterium]
MSSQIRVLSLLIVGSQLLVGNTAQDAPTRTAAEASAAKPSTAKTPSSPLFAGIPLTAPADDSIHSPRPGYWRTARNAGANALFLMLRGAGHDVDYERVARAVEVPEGGATMATVAAAANELGFPVRVGAASPEELPRLALPVILHLDPVAKDRLDGGRVVTVAAINETAGTATVIDGVTGIPAEITLEDLMQVWSGAVICSADQPGEAPGWSIWSVVLGLALLGFGIGGWTARSGGRS